MTAGRVDTWGEGDLFTILQGLLYAQLPHPLFLASIPAQHKYLRSIAQ